MRKVLPQILLFCFFSPLPLWAQNLLIQSLGNELKQDEYNIIAFQKEFSTAGSTSLRNNDKSSLIWKEQGYFQRNRDLGQVFVSPEDFKLKSIILRTGPSPTAILENTVSARIFIQFFEVVGEPSIHDNGTKPGNKATHGFTENHKGDDYIIGVKYKPIETLEGGIFPNIPPTLLKGNENPDSSGKLHYLRFELEGFDYIFKKGKRYAFVLGFMDEGDQIGFTLANINRASHEDLSFSPNTSPISWGIRREGNGINPPHLSPGEAPPSDIDLLKRLIEQSVFPKNKKRYKIPPTTDGYPDVDTYRDLEYYLEGNL
jgi:hypothetical protein